MKHRYLKSNLIACLLTATITGGCLFTSCEDWTDPEEVDYTIQDPSEQNPELWARYIESLRVYKLERPHYITYASFNNGIEPSKNEGDYIRSLPDSLDFVTLANSENITAADREDIPELQEKSTRVLYHVDYAKKMTELPDEAALGAWLDKAVATVAELNMDGFAFSGIPLYGGTDIEQAARKASARLIVSKLSATGKALVFEGDPSFVDAADMEKLDYVVLNTADIERAVALKLLVANTLEMHTTLSKTQLILATKMNGKLADEDGKWHNAVLEIPNRVVGLGPLGGMAIYSIGEDYYQPERNYHTCRTAIQMMNPSM
ncbi:glycoside hydrolase family 18 [Bacteroides congonensis]|uniref:glycoside hydrolase family 18 n=1 Tax=Bacteroides congonensis TaxID=1871006 RepID=UPI0009FB3DE7|nr:glycoside hydrolase family 18 [Bacteroides congonensis]